jgi:hypothetical protein
MAYLYGEPERKVASLRPDAEASGVSQAITNRGAGERSFPAAPGHELSAGDTLVIEEVGCLGENYEEVVDALRSLMRRKVRVHSVRDNITFDGAISNAGQQASRDTLIAYVAAAADAKKTARRAIELRQASAETEKFSRDKVIVQLRVIAAQLGALALAVYVLGFLLPVPHAKKTPGWEPPRAQVQQESGPKTAEAPPQSFSGGRLAEFGNGAKNQAKPPPNQELAQRLKEPDLPKGPDDPQKTNPLALTQEQAQKVYRRVSDWRSARVRNANVQAEIGAVVPRSVHLAIFPRELVAQFPQLRGDRFIVVGERVAVVDLPTRRITALIDQ